MYIPNVVLPLQRTPPDPMLGYNIYNNDNTASRMPSSGNSKTNHHNIIYSIHIVPLYNRCISIL